MGRIKFDMQDLFAENFEAIEFDLGITAGLEGMQRYTDRTRYAPCLPTYHSCSFVCTCAFHAWHHVIHRWKCNIKSHQQPLPLKRASLNIAGKYSRLLFSGAGFSPYALYRLAFTDLIAFTIAKQSSPIPTLSSHDVYPVVLQKLQRQSHNTPPHVGA